MIVDQEHKIQEDVEMFLSETLEYAPHRFIEYLKENIKEPHKENQESNLNCLKVLKNELIGQGDEFKKKLVIKFNIIGILQPFILNYAENNSQIIKEVSYVLNTVLSFLRVEQNPSNMQNSKKIDKFKSEFDKTALRMLPKILKEDQILAEPILSLLNLALDTDLLEPKDLVEGDYDVFEVIGNSDKNKRLVLQIISNILITLMSKNNWLLESSPNSEGAKALVALKKQLSNNLNLVDSLLYMIIDNRLSISDELLILALKALSWAAKNKGQSIQDDGNKICYHIIGYDRAVDELFEFLKYPHKGIKIQVSSLLTSLRNCQLQETEDVYKQYQLKYLQSEENDHVFQWILIELMNQNLGGIQGSYEMEIPKSKEQLQEMNLFMQICDTVIDILRFGKKKYQVLALQIGIIDKLWSCFFVHKSKVLQALKEITQNNDENIEHLINFEGFQQELFKSIQQNKDLELRHASIDLIGTLAGTEKKLCKQILLDKHKFVATLAKIFRDDSTDDHELQMLILRAINNFSHNNPREYAKEQTLIKQLCKLTNDFYDQCLTNPELFEPTKELIPQKNLSDISFRSLHILQTSLLYCSNQQIKDDIMNEVGWDNMVKFLEPRDGPTLLHQRKSLLILQYYLNIDGSIQNFGKIKVDDKNLAEVIIRILKINIGAEESSIKFDFYRQHYSLHCLRIIAMSPFWKYKTQILDKSIIDIFTNILFSEESLPNHDKEQQYTIFAQITSLIKSLIFKFRETCQDEEEEQLNKVKSIQAEKALKDDANMEEDQKKEDDDQKNKIRESWLRAQKTLVEKYQYDVKFEKVLKDFEEKKAYIIDKSSRKSIKDIQAILKQFKNHS